VPSADADTLPYDVASIEGECQVLPYWLRIGADPPPIVLKPMVAERGGAEEAGAAGGGAIGLGSDELPAVEHYGARGWTRRVGSVDLITLPHLALRGDAPTQPATDGAAEQPGIAARLRSKFLEAISAMASTFQARSGSSAAPPAVPPAAPINLAGGDFASLLQPKPGGAPLTAGSHEQIQAVLQALSQQMGQNMRAVVTVNAEGQLAISMAERHTERFRHASTVRALARVHRFHAICDTWAFAWVCAQRHLLSVDAPPDYAVAEGSQATSRALQHATTTAAGDDTDSDDEEPDDGEQATTSSNEIDDVTDDFEAFLASIDSNSADDSDGASAADDGGTDGDPEQCSEEESEL
jgi:hypothetical protein